MPTDNTPVGLIAGWGRYPIVVAQALRNRGHRIICAGLKDHADAQLRELSDAYTTISLAQVGAGIRFFRRHGVQTATMAGKVHKVLLFQRSFLLNHLPDWQGVRTFFPHFVTRNKDRKDDTLIGAVVETMARHGITIAPATDFAPELLVKSGPLTRRLPTTAEQKDIEFAWKIAKEIGRLDIGQSVAVQGRAVLAIEAVEGTDQCIRRAGELCDRGFTVVKVAKPQQDMRFDVPTIGLGTLESLVHAGGKVLAVEADKTILVDQSGVIEFANRHGLAIVAVHEGAAAKMARAA